MSYHDALQQLRAEQPAPPTFTEVQRKRRWLDDRRRMSGARNFAVLASCACAVGYLSLTVRPIVEGIQLAAGGWAAAWRGGVATLLPAILLLWAARLSRREGVGPQMLVRAIWWSNLVVGVLIAGAFSNDLDRWIGVGIAAACAAALISVGTRGLDGSDERDPFQPVRFRGQLLVALVMAFADAQTLAFSALMQLRIGMAGWNLLGTVLYAGPTILAAAVMAVTVWGLYRLRTWALIVNLVANIAIAYYALDGALGLSGSVAVALTMTAAVQSLLPYSIFAAALGDREAGRPILGRHGPRAVFVVVAMTASLALFARVGRSDGWLAGPGRAFQRGVGSGKTHERADLRGYDYSGWALTGHNFDGADLRNARLSSASGRGVRFSGADLRGADLRGADFPGVSITRADFRGAGLRGASLRGCHGKQVNLRDSDASAVSFVGCTISFEDVAGADLRDADFGFAVVSSWGEVDETATTQWEGARCPNLLPADAQRGCAERTGYFTPTEASVRARYVGLYAPTPVPGGPPMNPLCAAKLVPAGQTRLVLDGYLFFANHRFLRQTDETFVGLVDGAEFRLEFSWADDGTPQILSRNDACGAVVWRRVP